MAFAAPCFAARPQATPSVRQASSSQLRSQEPERSLLSSRQSGLFGANLRRFESNDSISWHADVTCMAKPAPSSTPSTSAPAAGVPPVPLIGAGIAIAAAAFYAYKNWPEIQEKIKKGELFKAAPPPGSVDEDDDGEPKKGPVLYNYECTKCGMVIFPAPHAKIWTKFMDEKTGELREDFKCTNPKCGAGRESFVKKIPKKFDPSRPPPPPQPREAPAAPPAAPTTDASGESA
eukprot:tig00001155_g7325.t1